MSAGVRKSIEACFREYTDVLKPALAMTESLSQEFPGPVLNEIRAVFDHISRCYAPELTENECLEEMKKGRGHLLRAILDCYKALLITYEDGVKKFGEQYKNVDLTLVGDGDFLPELNRLHQEAKNLAIQAREEESSAFPNKEDAFNHYQKAIVAYSRIPEYIKGHSKGLALASQRARKKDLKAIIHTVFGAVLGAVLGIVLTILYERLSS